MRESASIPKSADELDWELAKLLRRRLIFLANWRGTRRSAQIGLGCDQDPIQGRGIAAREHEGDEWAHLLALEGGGRSRARRRVPLLSCSGFLQSFVALSLRVNPSFQYQAGA